MSKVLKLERLKRGLFYIALTQLFFFISMIWGYNIISTLSLSISIPVLLYNIKRVYHFDRDHGLLLMLMGLTAITILTLGILDLKNELVNGMMIGFSLGNNIVTTLIFKKIDIRIKKLLNKK